MTSSLGYMELCRLCLVKDKVTVPIFGDTNDVRQIFLKITACLPVKVSRDDNLPKKICDTCLYKIDLLYQFWNTTINAEKQLIQWLNEIGVDAKNVDASLQMLPQSHAHPHAMQEEIMMKEERIESETKDGATGFSNMYTEYPYQNPENNFDTSSVVEETTTAKRKTRGRPAGKKKAKVVIPESEDEDSIGSDRLGNDDTNDSDSDGGKIAKQEADSDEDYVDNPESLEPTTFVDVPSAADAEQPGPSGLSKPATITAGTSDQGKKPGLLNWEHDYAFQITAGSTKIQNIVRLNRNKNSVTKHKSDKNILVDKTDIVNRISNIRNKQKRVLKRPSPEPEEPPQIKEHKCYTIRVVSADGKEKHQCTYSCEVCGKIFRSKRCSAKTCKLVSKDPNNKFYLCEICGKVFNFISSFIAHHNFKHRESKLFLKEARLSECNICHKRFSTKWNMKIHMQSHLDYYPYLCEICGKKFKKSDIFKIHLRVHAGIKPYSCQTCQKCFVTKGMLTTHIRSHTGEKPYACDFCEKSYAGMTALRLHRRMHTGERPFKCHLCPNDKGFISKKALRIHLKQPHHD